MDPKMHEILKAVMDEEIEDEARLDAWIEKQKFSDKEAAALKSAMRILGAFGDNAKIKKVSDAMAGMVGFPAKKAADPIKPEPKKDKPSEPEKKEEPVKKDDPKVPEAIQKQLDDANARVEKAEKKSEELSEKVEVETRKRERAEILAKCEKLYLHVPGMSTDEQADLLLGLDEKGREAIEKQWAATEEAIVKSELLTSRGSGGFDATGGDAEMKLDQLAKGMVEKSTDDLTYADAYAKAMGQNPGLYQQYLDENPAQSGRKE